MCAPLKACVHGLVPLTPRRTAGNAIAGDIPPLDLGDIAMVEDTASTYTCAEGWQETASCDPHGYVYRDALLQIKHVWRLTWRAPHLN